MLSRLLADYLTSIHLTSQISGTCGLQRFGRVLVIAVTIVQLALWARTQTTVSPWILCIVVNGV